MGVSLGYLLAQQGAEVELFEAAPALGGLAGSTRLEEGLTVDRFYHTILSSDRHLAQLCDELGLTPRLRFRETQMGFYHQGRIYSMNNVVEFLRFPPLGWIDRFRLGLTVLYAQLVKDWKKLEGISVEDWLKRLSGRRMFENIWRPMLRAKFDGSFQDVPATYIWSRLVRMKSTRGGASQKEEAGYLVGGYTTLLEAMAERIRGAGGHIHLDSAVQEIVVGQGRAVGLRVAGTMHAFDALVATPPLPKTPSLNPGADPAFRDFLAQTENLGIDCPLLVLDRPLSGFWTLNITDERVPFTGIIETTSYIDPEWVGGNHLVYLPKYTAPGSPWQRMSDEEIRRVWLQHLEAMFPAFSRQWIRHFAVHREPFVEPLHRPNSAHLIPPIRTPIERLYLATTAQIYPALTNVESVSRHARECARAVLEPSPGPIPAPTRGA